MGLQARTTLNNSSLFDIITVVAFAFFLYSFESFLYSRHNEAVKKVEWGHVKWIVSAI